jgi:hypothetical protein
MERALLDDEFVLLRRGGGRQHVNKERRETREARSRWPFSARPPDVKTFGHERVAEGFVVPTKPGNSGGGKEP